MPCAAESHNVTAGEGDGARVGSSYRIPRVPAVARQPIFVPKPDDAPAGPCDPAGLRVFYFFTSGHSLASSGLAASSGAIVAISL